MTSVYKINKPRHRSRVAIFDFDWTLCKPKNNKTFPKDVDDWEWLRPSVPDIIKNLYKKGFAICIATNQSKEWKHTQIQNAIATLDIPATICIATTKDTYKPSLAIYNSLFKKEINKEKSFMCGDALGRPNDYSNSDLKFAKAMGLKIISPEEMFPFEKKNRRVIVTSHQEIVILSGYPASGKSYIAETVFKKHNYVIIDGDTYKTSAKMIKLAKEPIENGKSIVFDATNATREKRAEYIEFAEKYKISVRCIHLNTSLEEALARNNNREKPVPKIVYNVYNKRFQMPDSQYDMCEVIII